MRNQTSFRLTTTLLPTGDEAKTTTVINKLDANGEKFYPTFTEETVVITNDDRTVIETTRATCNNGVLSFVKRGLSDDASGTPIASRKLTWNPGSLCFITAGASDWIDKDDDIIWTGNQTYTGNMTSTGSATYNGLLITNKGVKYPAFANVEALEAYENPFGGMFATVNSTGELYRYNAVTQQWDVITTNEPTTPEMADDETIGTVRVATDAEFAAGTITGSHGEYLMPTIEQVKGTGVEVFVINDGETSTSVFQPILDRILAGKYIIIRLVKSSGNSHYYIPSNFTSRYVQFIRTLPDLDTDTSCVTLPYIQIYYSGTDATSINYTSSGIYVTRIE